MYSSPSVFCAEGVSASPTWESRQWKLPSASTSEFQQVRLYWQPVFDKGLKQTTQIKQSNLNYRTIGFTAIFYIQWMVLSHFHDVATPAADNVALKEWPVLV